MVALVLILVTVAGTYFLGFGQEIPKKAPNAVIEFNDADDDFRNLSDNEGDNEWVVEEAFIQIFHDGGDSIRAANMRIFIRNVSTNNLIAKWNGTAWKNYEHYWDETAIRTDRFDSNSELSSGDRILIRVKGSASRDANQVPSDGVYTVLIVHRPANQVIASGSVTVR